MCGRDARHGVLVPALAFIALALLLEIRYQPPTPESATAPPEVFSAARARMVLQRLLAENTPHPIGSDANRRIRQRIEADLTHLGYVPTVQRAFICSEVGTCGYIENVLARLPGREPETAVLLAAHYDSVSAGPGASDDGAGVAAIIEIARVLKQSPPLRHTVMLLLDDGEEPLLLGARAFMTKHPWAQHVRAAVNLDAGGSSGPSVLLRTSRNNRDSVRLFARTVKRPVTSSFLSAGFRRLQHDTDFTEFTRGTVQAFDFAYFAHRLHYHTSLDNLENVDLGSLQHHGEQALALVRALADGDLDQTRSTGDAVFFDLIAIQTVWWPSHWTRPLTLAGGVGILLTIGLQRRRRNVTGGAVAAGFAIWFASIAIGLAVGLVLNRVLRAAHTLPGPWIANPGPAALAYAAFGIATTALLASLVRYRLEGWALWAGTWIGWTVLASLIAWPAPEASYVLLVPMWAAAIGGLVRTLWRSESGEPGARGTLVIIVIAAAVMMPAIGFVYQAVGTGVFPVITATAALVTTAAIPLSMRGGRWSVPAISAGIGMVATGIAVVMPAYSARAPQGANLIFHQDADSGTARWIVSGPGGGIVASWRPPGNFGPANQPFVWPSGPALVRETTRVDVPAPEFLMLETTDRPGGREVRGVLRSPRGASQVSLMIAPAVRVEAVTVHDTAAPPIHPRFLRQSQGWRTYTCLTTPPDGVEVRLVLSTPGPTDIVVLDQSPGVPPHGHGLLASRPPTAVAVGDGDVTVITRRVRLVP